MIRFAHWLAVYCWLLLGRVVESIMVRVLGRMALEQLPGHETNEEESDETP